MKLHRSRSLLYGNRLSAGTAVCVPEMPAIFWFSMAELNPLIHLVLKESVSELSQRLGGRPSGRRCAPAVAGVIGVGRLLAKPRRPGRSGPARAVTRTALPQCTRARGWPGRSCFLVKRAEQRPDVPRIASVTDYVFDKADLRLTAAQRGTVDLYERIFHCLRAGDARRGDLS
jgi:hypothetical protein